MPMCSTDGPLTIWGVPVRWGVSSRFALTDQSQPDPLHHGLHVVELGLEVEATLPRFSITIHPFKLRPELDLEPVGPVVPPSGSTDLQTAIRRKSFIPIPTGVQLIALNNPLRNIGVKRAVHHKIGAPLTEDFNVVDQAFARA